MQRLGGFFRRFWKSQAQYTRQAQRAGHARLAGPRESEKLQHIEQRRGRGFQSPRHESGMGHQHIAALEKIARFGLPDARGLAGTMGGRAGRRRHQRDKLIK